MDHLDQRNKARLAKALAVVKHAMHEYDVLGEVPKIRFVPPDKSILDRDQRTHSRNCAHDIPLHKPCKMCGRTDEDCIVYIQAAMMRAKELLSKIKPRP